jgi:predicted phosphoribosyltransferase
LPDGTGGHLQRMSETVYADRSAAGRALARRLEDYRGRDDVVVLGLPRGGVPVAFEVAREIRAPLEVFTVRKVGVPGQEELAMGAIASGGAAVMNRQVTAAARISREVFDRAAERESVELRRREEAYRGGRPPLHLEGRTALLVDDGLATGSTMRAAVQAVRELGPDQVVVAVPVAPESAVRELGALADAVVCLQRPEHFMAVGQWYRDFGQTTDDEVRDLLAAAENEREA